MAAVSYGVARVPADVAERAQTGPRKSFLVRLMDALAESRLRQAHREIEKYAHLLSPDHFRREH